MVTRPSWRLGGGRCAGHRFGAPTLAENELAELIVEAVPSIEKLRLVNLGTEATMSAIRLARGYTGRPMIVKFAGNYHGHVDSLLVAAGSSAATLGAQFAGRDRGAAARHAGLPLQRPAGAGGGFHPAWRPDRRRDCRAGGGQHGLRRVDGRVPRGAARTDPRARRLLIADEVMTGFRVAYGGAQSLLGIQPDLTTLGKIIGGGLPVGAYGGRAEIMDHILPAGKVFQAGTLSGNPLATAAGIATLKTLRDSESLSAVGTAIGPTGRRAGIGGHGGRRRRHVGRVRLDDDAVLSARPVTDWDTAARCDTQQYARYFWGMIDRGVYLPCSQYEALFVSTAHSEADIDATIPAAGEVFSSFCKQ